jgi:hypothetical protein
VNGVASIAGAASSNLSTANTFLIGVSDFAGAKNNYFAGKILHLFFASSVLSASTIARVVSYFESLDP